MPIFHFKSTPFSAEPYNPEGFLSKAYFRWLLVIDDPGVRFVRTGILVPHHEIKKPNWQNSTYAVLLEVLPYYHVSRVRPSKLKARLTEYLDDKMKEFRSHAEIPALDSEVTLSSALEFLKPKIPVLFDFLEDNVSLLSRETIEANNVRNPEGGHLSSRERK
jgi:hypothetical protein